MKPLLSENGSVELGFGVTLAVAGAAYHLFPWWSISPFWSGALFAAGVILACYGYSLRKAWNDKIRKATAEIGDRRNAAHQADRTDGKTLHS